MHLAETLKMTMGQIRDLPNEEYVNWVAYFMLKNDRQKLANSKARRKNKR